MAHISYSELKIWSECPYKHKIIYVDGIKAFKGNEYSAFGTALHEAAELKVLDDSVNEVTIFENKFLEELKTLKNDNYDLNTKMIAQMREQGIMLAPLITPALKEQFGNYKVLAAEEDLYEKIRDTEDSPNFKGFIDLIIQTEDQKIHIIDWKTCSWGWDMKKKSDPIVNYQLTLYKHFYAQKHKVDLDSIETHFALLKRTAKKNQVEIFRVTSGKKKVENAFNILNKALYNIENKKYIKNKNNCQNCEFYKTKECP